MTDLPGYGAVWRVLTASYAGYIVLHRQSSLAAPTHHNNQLISLESWPSWYTEDGWALCCPHPPEAAVLHNLSRLKVS